VKGFKRHGRTSLFGTLTILVILLAILLYTSNTYQQAQIKYSYCGDFGFYGKTLTLLKDNTFRFNYHGCSQEKGYVRGAWTKDNNILTLKPDQPDEHLDTQYKGIDNQLVPMNLEEDEEFVLCNDYIAFKQVTL
jgi:hypothetical protein